MNPPSRGGIAACVCLGDGRLDVYCVIGASVGRIISLCHLSFIDRSNVLVNCFADRALKIDGSGSNGEGQPQRLADRMLCICCYLRPMERCWSTRLVSRIIGPTNAIAVGSPIGVPRTRGVLRIDGYLGPWLGRRAGAWGIPRAAVHDFKELLEHPLLQLLTPDAIVQSIRETLVGQVLGERVRRQLVKLGVM